MKTYILSAIFPGTVGIVLGATLFNNIELTKQIVDSKYL